ncbi:MAG: site-2 protease family protein [Verrucomicrobia bacterium]|nr:site-2 protease family protein [Verrucomicrobiota bacterium]
MFIQQISINPVFYFSWIVLAAFSICCHEYAHAYTALRVGDDTAARAGHLTLNPLVQMGIQSLIMLVLFGIARGAVPVGLENVRKPRNRALISLAGPLSNLILCFIFSLLLVIAQAAKADRVVQFLFIGGAVNGMLFVLNILPVPVLDGFAVLSAFNAKLEVFAQKHATAVFLVFILLLWNTPLGSLIFGGGYALQGFFVALFQGLVA